MSNIGAVQDTNQFPAMIAHTGTAGTADVQRVVADTEGNLKVQVLNSLVPKSSTGGTVSYPDSTTEVYKFLSGTIAVGTITLYYTDSTKSSLLRWSA